MSQERMIKRSLADRQKGKTDWSRLRALSEAEIERAAIEDPDNQPWNDAELHSARLVLPAPGAAEG